MTVRKEKRNLDRSVYSDDIVPIIMAVVTRCWDQILLRSCSLPRAQTEKNTQLELWEISCCYEINFRYFQVRENVKSCWKLLQRAGHWWSTYWYFENAWHYWWCSQEKNWTFSFSRLPPRRPTKKSTKETQTRTERCIETQTACPKQEFQSHCPSKPTLQIDKSTLYICTDAVQCTKSKLNLTSI